MNSAADIWERVLSLMKQTMTETTITTWFSDAEPVALDENRFILYVPTDFKREIVVSRYLKDIKKALYDLFSEDLDVVVLSEDEKDKYAKKEPPSRFLPGTEEYTFERFVVGNSNKLAHAAALAVAEHPAENYNPLFIHGESGLGKTHLLYAIAHQVRQRQPEARIVYIKGDDFTNELIASIREGKNAEFREKYRQSTLLLVDDIQFIAGKKQTQEEFFHTFNTLYESGRQIVLTSDRPPREMTQLEDRLQTRFEWGLMVDVAPPDFETRLAIIKNKAALLGVQLPDDISSFIAENLTANVRQIEGALNKLLAYRDLLGNQVDGEAVSRAVKDMLKKYNEFVPSPALIIEYICRYYDVDEEQVRGQGRKRDLMEARQTAMYLIRRMTNLSLNDIGKEFGDRDHTTVLHSLDQVEKKMRSDPAYAEKVKEITTNINNKK